MSQVDIETHVCGGGDRKVACKTTLINAAADDRQDPPSPAAAQAAAAAAVAEDPDLPPESIEVPIGSEAIDWASLNAVYDRDDSTKGNTNPKSNLNSNPNPNPRPRSNSRTNLNSAKKPPIIALPGRFLPRLRRPTPPPPPPPPPRPQGRIIPRPEEAGAGAGTGADPGSPEVSCFGKVLSDREHRRRRRRNSAARGGGCWAAFVAALGCGGGGEGDTKMAAGAEEEEEEEEVVGAGSGSARPYASVYAGDRGLKRLVSGRREGEHAAGGGEAGWGRGSVGLVEEEDVPGRGRGGRGWE